MASVSPQDVAADKAVDAINQAAINKLTPVLKKNYIRLRDAYLLKHPEDSALFVDPHDDAGVDLVVNNLARQLVAGDDNPDKKEADRARDLLAIMESKADDKEKEDIDKLKLLPKIRKAARHAVSDNTGSIDFLGGSTIGNALSGLFSWVMSGFEGGFDGLKKIIAQGAVINTSVDFAREMHNDGVDINHGVGRDIVGSFYSAASKEAGLPPPPGAPAADAAAAPDLHGIKIEGLTESQKPIVIDPAHFDPDKALGDRFSKILTDTLDPYKDQIDKSNPDLRPLLDKAKAAFIEEGKKMVAGYAKSGQALPADFNKQLIEKAFKDVQEKLGNNDPNKALIEKMLKNFEGSASMDDVIKKMIADPKDEQMNDMALLLRGLNTNLVGANADLMAIAAQMNDKLKGAADQAKKDQATAAQAEQQKQRETVYQTVVRDVGNKAQEALNPKLLQAEFDSAIQTVISNDYSINPNKHERMTIGGYKIPGTGFLKAVGSAFVTDTTASLTGAVPDDSERAAMAKLTSDNLGKFLTMETDKLVRSGKPFDPEAVKQAVMKDFGALVDSELAKDHSDIKGWAKYKDMLLNKLGEKLGAQLIDAAPGINQALDGAKVSLMNGITVPGITPVAMGNDYLGLQHTPQIQQSAQPPQMLVG